MSKYTVEKCICHKRTFQEIKDYARRKGYQDVKSLQAEKYCSCQCGFCIPYIEMVLETGETVFEPGAYLRRN
ncbi:hypothetical protein ACG2F4_06150 [Halalkalibaculum sp. DA3122]|uniref:hypothetical protein n=1 Tax=unclassified Halalkalibaculum TaxID=2964617 RepID=UPI003754EDC1